jgi:hypothetical protein
MSSQRQGGAREQKVGQAQRQGRRRLSLNVSEIKLAIATVIAAYYAINNIANTDCQNSPADICFFIRGIQLAPVDEK